MPDDQQFDEVLRAYQDKVFRLCCAMLGDRALAEETAQEALLRMWKALPRYRGESSLSTWIYAIARNACLTAMKKRRARPTLSLDLEAVRHEAERTAAGTRAPDRRPDVLRLMDRLPDHYRQVVLLFTCRRNRTKRWR